MHEPDRVCQSLRLKRPHLFVLFDYWTLAIGIVVIGAGGGVQKEANSDRQMGNHEAESKKKPATTTMCMPAKQAGSY